MRIVDSLSRPALYAGLIIGVLLATGSLLAARQGRPTTTTQVCADDNGGITLPADSARRCSRTTSAMPGTSSWRRTAVV